MSASANTQVHVPRPKVWQTFEKGSAHLWRQILKDPSLHRFGRNGQAQHGMDMHGYRDGDSAKFVGIQCKCKGLDEQATEAEFRADFEKALKYEPKLTEYYFTTTADDHAPLQTFAAKLTEEQRLAGRNIIVRAWGWSTLEDELSAHPEVAYVFDPNHSPTAQIQSARHDDLITLNEATLAEVRAMRADLITLSGIDPLSDTSNPAEAALDAEIDRYRDRANSGKPRSALDLLQALQKTLTDNNSGHIWFRVKANIAHCYLKLGDDETAATILEEAVEHAPEDPKAPANVVLALMLRGKHQEALDRALIELAKTPDNEALAGYAVQAAGHAGVEDVLDRLSSSMRNTDTVYKYTLLNRRNAGSKDWIELARTARDEHPEDTFFKRQAADADIQSVVDDYHKLTWILRADDRPKLRAAADVLIAAWNEEKVSEIPDGPESLALCINATLALIALGEETEARDLIVEGLDISKGEDPEIVTRAAALALEVGDKTLVDRVFPQLAAEGPALLMRAQIAARYGNWNYLADLADAEVLETVPDTERDIIKALAAGAAVQRLAATDAEAAGSRLDQLISDYSTSGRASVLLAQVADDLGSIDASATAYRNAIATITDTSHIASRTMVAGYSAKRHDHASVIKLMDGHVDTQKDHRELHELASAFAYEFPPRARAVAFFSALPEEIRQAGHYVILEGITHYHRGDLDAALERFERASELAPEQIQPILMQIQTLFRLKKRDELPALVAALDPSRLKGSPENRVNLAQAMAAGGRVDDALQLGFETLQAHPDDPKVCLKWLGLGLGNLRRLHEMSDAPIAVGMWTRLVSDDAQVSEFLIVDGPGQPSEGRYGAGHSLAEAAIGKRAGDSFTVEDRIGRERRWTVEKVQHKYLRAYEDLTENFNTRFPEEDGFFVVRTIDDDIEPFLDLMRKQGERRQRILDLYAEGGMPISAIVELSGTGDVVRFADSLRMNGISIEACEGNYPERLNAMALVERNAGKGVVLDTLTFWALVGMDGLCVLKKVFGRVLVPRSTADDITRLQEDDTIVEGGERKGSAYFHNGNFYFDEFTAEREQQISDAIAKRDAALRDECEVAPVHASPEVDPLILEHLHRGTLDPIFVAQEHGLLLVSDDKRFRSWARSVRVEGVWLQAVFLHAIDRGLITSAEYARLSAELASLRHTSVTCNGDDIVEIVRQATPETRYTIRAISDVIGTKNAEINSHFRVVTDAIHSLWNDGPTLDGLYAISMLMQNLLRYRRIDGHVVLKYLELTFAPLHGGADYFKRWKVGHFIVDPQRSPPKPEQTVAITQSRPGKRRGKAHRRSSRR